MKDLGALLAPRSVAVIGASQKGGRATGAVQNLQDLGFTGAIHPVNPNYDTVLGLRCYPSVEAIPGPVDLIAVGIPGERALEQLRAAHRKGVKAAVIFASGFAEAGEQGRARQAELEAFARQTGMLICGPNCLGVVNLAERSCGYSSISPKEVAVGDVAVISQSGTVIVALVRSLRGLGFSHLVSSGNEAVLTSGDYLNYLASDPATKVLGVFLEGLKEPARFIEAASAARRAGKPIVALKAGRSAEGQAASLAHTGSLAGSAVVHDALFRQNGIIQCADLDEWIEAIEIFRYARPPASRGIGLIGVSGGENALVLDHAAELGLSVPPLSESGAQPPRRVPALVRPSREPDRPHWCGDPGPFALQEMPGGVGRRAAHRNRRRVPGLSGGVRPHRRKSHGRGGAQKRQMLRLFQQFLGALPHRGADRAARGRRALSAGAQRKPEGH